MERDARLRTADEIMTAPVFALRPDMPAREAAVVLVRRGFSGAPVVDENHHLLGIVSEHDLIRALAAAAFDASPTTTVEGLMTRHATTVSPGTDIFQVAAMLERSGVRRLPVVSDGRVIGLVTRRNVLETLAEICAERCAEDNPGTLDAMARLEEIHNPFPQRRRVE